MTPAARVQAAIELLDAVIAAAQADGAPADRLVSDYFRTRRYAGSKDRRAVRELVYRAIRACGPLPPSGRAAMLRLVADDSSLAPLFDGSTHGPAPVGSGETPAEGGIAPEWLLAELAASGIADAEAAALLDRAPLDLRVNTLKADRSMIELPAPVQATDAPQGLRVEPASPVETWEEFRDGRIDESVRGSEAQFDHARGGYWKTS